MKDFNVSELTPARPYAKAVFQVAQADKALEDWKDFLAAVNMLSKDANVKRLLRTPKLMAVQKADFLVDVIRAEKESLSESQENFVRLLIQNDRFNLAAAISFLYCQYFSHLNDVVQVSVKTAFPFSPEHEKQLVAAIEKRFKAKPEITYEEDESLIAGAVIRIGDDVIDSSIKNRLAQLKSALIED